MTSAAKTEVLPSTSRTIKLWFVSRICLHGQPRWTRDEFLVSSFKRRCHVSASHLPSHLPSGHLPASLGRWGNSLKHGLAKKKQHEKSELCKSHAPNLNARKHKFNSRFGKFCKLQQENGDSNSCADFSINGSLHSLWQYTKWNSRTKK